ncbi:MAG: hypothetical protein AAGD43_02520 [Pseudomonadota bacterium]
MHSSPTEETNTEMRAAFPRRAQGREPHPASNTSRNRQDAGTQTPDAAASAQPKGRSRAGADSPRSAPAHPRRFYDLPPAQQAGILCNTPLFQRFVALRLNLPTDEASTQCAAEFVRDVCRVSSRSELDNLLGAAKRFAALKTEYDAWRGRIGRPE